MIASRKLSLCLSISALLLVLLAIWNPSGDESLENTVSERPAPQDPAATQLEEFGPHSELGDPYSTELTDPAPSGEAPTTSLSRSTHHQLLLPPHRTLDRKADTSVVFEEPVFHVSAGAPTGPLALNEHTLSAVEADYDPRVIDRFLQSDAGAVRLPLDGEKSVVLEISRVVSRGPFTTSLIGKISKDPFSDVTLVFHDGVVSGSIAFIDKDIHYQFGSAGNGKVAIRRLDPSTFTAKCENPHGSNLLASDPTTSGKEGSFETLGNSEDSAPEETAAPAPFGEENNPSPGGESDALYTMDTVTGYGREARIAEGGVAAIEALIIASVDRTNTAFLNSLIADTELVLLGTIEDPDYVFPGATAGTMNSGDELGDLNNASDGVLDIVTDLKALVGADHAGFVVKQTDGSAGVAYRPGQSMIVSRTYMTSTRLTFVHEFGHNIGCRHAWGDSSGDSVETDFNYGWRIDPPSSSKVRTVMAYDWSWTRIPHFSDPDVFYNGAKTGAVDGYNATGDATADPRAVSGGYQGGHGAGYDGTNPSLGARNADYIQANAQFVADNATRVVAPPGPEISVHQPSGTNLTDGSAVVDFGYGTETLSTRRTFTILNEGGDPLTEVGATLTGPDVSEFSITQAPASTMGSLSISQLKVEFSPNSVGPKTATLFISSNDADENPFEIVLTGEGFLPLTSFSDDFDPDYDASLWAELGASIAANTYGQNAGAGSTGNSLWFGGAGNRVALTLPIDTSAGGSIAFLVAKSDGSISNWNAVETGEELYLEYTTDGSSFVEFAGPFNSTTWEQQTISIPVAAQTEATQFRFNQRAHSGSNFDNYAIEDLVIGPPPSSEPEITIEQPLGTNRTDGVAVISFGTEEAGASSSRTFTIKNDGAADLTGLGITIDGTHATEFSVTASPTSPLPAGGSTSFTIDWNPLTSGSKTAKLHIASNDADENPFDIALSGTALAPQITIEDSGGSPIVSGAATIDFGSVPVDGSSLRNYTIRNTGSASLQIDLLQRSGAHPGDFGAGLSGGGNLAPGATVTLQTNFSPSATGARSSGLTVFSNSSINSQFTISMAGTGLAPELSISPLSANKAEGTGSTTSFTFSVTRSGYTAGATTVDYGTTGSGGNPASPGDFQNGFPTGTVSFAANETGKTITIPVNADGLVEAHEGFTVTLSNPSGGATFGTPSASGTIQNDDALTVSIDTLNAGDNTAIEGGSPGILTLTHNEPGRATPVEVALSTASSVADTSEFSLTGSAASFTGATGSATIPANQTSAQISIVALVEAIKAAEPAEDVVVQIQSNAGYSIGSPASATVTIEQNSFLVTNVNDFNPATSANAGTGTLRQAVLNANALGGTPTIEVDTANPPFDDTTVDVITLTEGELTLSESVLLDGPGARLLDISGNNSSRIFRLTGGPGSQITLRNLSIRNGNAIDGGGILNLSAGAVSIANATISGNVATSRGGAIFNNGSSDLSLYESTISGNTGGNTGGVFLETGYAYLRGSTISGNTATSTGAGGATVFVGTTLELANVTVTGNQSPSDGGGIHNAGGSVQPGNTIIAGNNGPASSPDISGPGAVSSGNNLVGDATGTTGPHGYSALGDQAGTSATPINAKLLPLADNGGPTNTHALAGSSPAIDGGSSAAAGSNVSVFDQRGTGFPRTFDRNGDGLATIDIGSFEAGLPTLVINEIEADNAGPDTAEFIEIYDGGIGNTDLDNTVLVFFDGSTDLSYHAIDLTGFSTNNEGYFLVGNSGVTGAAATFADDLLQNADATGSDAVALFLGSDTNFPNGSTVTTDGIIDALVYKDSGQADDAGLAPLLLPGQAGFNDDAASNEGGHSLQRYPNGSGGARSTNSHVAMAPTPGAENLAPTAPTVPDLESLSDTGISTSDDITMLARPALSGTGTPGVLLTLSSNLDGTLGTTSVDSFGNWTFTPASDLSDSLHLISAEADAHVQSGSEGISGSLGLQIDTASPSVTVNQAVSQIDPATADPVRFLAIFTESTLSTANGFSNSDVAIAGTATATTASVLEASPNDGTTFEITVSGAAGDGTIAASIPAGAVEDIAGNANTASTRVDNVVTVASELDTPTGISASDLTFSDRIRVSWSPVATAQSYDVFRNTTTDFGTASFIGNANGTEGFDDFSASGSPVSYFYWIKAKKTVSSVMRESSEGGPDEGSRAVDQHGNTSGTATALTFNSGVATVTGTLEAGDTDFFTLTLPQPYHLSIFTSGTVDTRGTLRDSGNLERNDPGADDDAAGDGLNFRIETALGQGVYTVEVTSQSPDESGSYSLHLELGDLATIQPDSLVGRGETSLLGDDSYGAAASLTLASKKARGVRGVFAVENDGEVRDQFTCRASAGNGTFRVTYLTDEGNVTAALIAGTHQPAAMEPGDVSHLINASIRPVRGKIKKVKKIRGKKKVKWLKKRYTSHFVATSTVDESIEDSSTLRVLTK
ncbi:MAG: choice-of-anchor D domain-containing protein [Verrucomicrobiales bacterium]|nr:choice-of-anchor D domain-containing protein [Verrucomicrobiales bacterium]